MNEPVTFIQLLVILVVWETLMESVGPWLRGLGRDLAARLSRRTPPKKAAKKNSSQSP